MPKNNLKVIQCQTLESCPLCNNPNILKYLECFEGDQTHPLMIYRKSSDSYIHLLCKGDGMHWVFKENRWIDIRDIKQ